MNPDNRKAPYDNTLVNHVAIILALSASVLIALRLSAGELHSVATFTGITVTIVLLFIAHFSGKKISATQGAWTLVIMS